MTFIGSEDEINVVIIEETSGGHLISKSLKMLIDYK
jgi:hypothetical protein